MLYLKDGESQSFPKGGRILELDFSSPRQGKAGSRSYSLSNYLAFMLQDFRTLQTLAITALGLQEASNFWSTFGQ